MTERSHKALVALQLLLLLAPATLAVSFLLLAGLPALPQRSLSAPQLAFDAGVAALVAGTLAGWRLAVRYLSGGRSGLRRLSRAWLLLLLLGALVGLAGALIAIPQLLAPGAPDVAVGFALLAPGALLALLAAHLLQQKKTGP